MTCHNRIWKDLNSRAYFLKGRSKRWVKSFQMETKQVFFFVPTFEENVEYICTGGFFLFQADFQINFFPRSSFHKIDYNGVLLAKILDNIIDYRCQFKNLKF